MKPLNFIKLILLILVLFIGKNNIFADPVVINVPNAGDLSTLIDESDKYQIADLTLTGDLNGDDIAFIQDIAGSNGNLAALNLASASFVAGGKDTMGGDEMKDNYLATLMFAMCEKLEKITLPSNLDSGGFVSFLMSNNLKEIHIAESNATFTTVDGVLFSKDKTEILTYPPNKIGSSYNLPEGLTSIMHSAFRENKHLEILVLPASVNNIDEYAFNNCAALKEINIPEGVTELKGEIFKNCGNLKDILFPNSLKTIGGEAFQNCTSLKNIELPYGVETIKESAFHSSGIESISIPASVTTIEDWVFWNCNQLTSLKIYHDANNILPFNDNWIENTIKTNCTLYVPEGSSDTYNNAYSWKDFSQIIEFEMQQGEPEIEPLAVTKNVETAGTLSNLIDVADKNKITELTLTGYLNGADILFIREMAGSGLNGQPTEGNLQILDMSGASIVAGGGMYLDNPDVGQMYTSNNELGAVMFGLCRKLEKITLPSNLTSGGFVTFLMCDKLQEIIINENNTAFTTINGVLFTKDKTEILTYPANKIGQTYSLPNELTTITHSAFRGNIHLRHLELPDNVTAIEHYAFDGCSALEVINIPESVTELKGEVFKDCSNLQNISLPNSLKTIGDAAFQNCNNLQSIALPYGLISIGQSAFMDAGLKSLSIPETVTNIDEAAFLKCDLSEGVELSENLEKINVQLFAYSNLQSIVLPESVTKIDNMAFAACIALNSIALSKNLESIGEEAFENCGGINSLRLPASLTHIGEKAFRNCAGLEQLVVFNPTPITIDANTFENVPTGSCMLIVPDESVSAYQSAPVWNQFNIVDFITENQNLKTTQTIIFADKNTIIIKGAKEKSEVKIYSITGSLIKSFSTNTNYETVKLLTRGIYLVKVDDVNYKVNL